MKIPLDDHAAMYVGATRTRRHRPCIGLVRRFDEPVTGDALLRWANELAHNPRGFGRRVVRPRVPGARLRWQAAADLPPMRYEPDALDGPEIVALLEDEVSSQPDPATAPGWRLAAARTRDGGSIVTLWVNHAYGDARAILSTAFDAAAAPADPPVVPRRWRTETVEELTDVVQRVRHGVGGSVRLGREAAGAWRSAATPGDLQRLTPTIAALRERDRGVGVRSGRRNVALVRTRAEDWDTAARDHGGSGNTLLLAVVANLIRGARQSRGETTDRPLRILLPVDLRHQRPNGQHDVTANAVVGALVVLDGGAPRHGRLDEVRHATKAAIEAAAPAGAQRRDGRPAGPTGTVDAMRLLPDALTHRMAVLAQGADGVASNVGPIPPQVGRLGAHRAAESYLLGGPMMTDLTVCLGRSGGDITLGVVADAGRLGPGGTAHARVEAELAAWGVPGTVW
ncbi:hypothetical protein [Patulibacter americanus]|uniref:hypothetical protein n=1 Tax=Patulibacter americanus TaxID=588672 RepID=UPI0003B64D0A|nr:hypothetical protein [Patulibacter americanus]